MGRISTADIQGWVGFGEAGILSLAQGFTKRQLLLTHPGKDVVGRPVQDTHDLLDPIPHQALPNHLDDRDSPADRGLEFQVDLFRLRQGEQFRSPEGQERFVRRDDMFSRFDCRADDLIGDLGAPDQLDHNLNFFVFHDAAVVLYQQLPGDHIPSGGDIDFRDPRDFHGCTHLAGKMVSVPAHQFVEAAAHRAQTHEADLYSFHTSSTSGCSRTSAKTRSSAERVMWGEALMTISPLAPLPRM